MAHQYVLIDDPAPGVRRITLNRPDKRNALSHPLRGAILEALREGDQDPEVKVQIIRGGGKCFSAGYDLANGNEGHEEPFYTPAGDGHWPRHVTEGWMSIWDLAKPVIAQVHGYCLAGGSELATGCDLVYVADDAEIGYPAVRFGVPDMHFHSTLVGMRSAMEMMLTGDAVTGVEAARLGWATASVELDELEDHVLTVANKICHIPADIVQLNKRVVHRSMEIQGFRTAIRSGTELCALGVRQESFQQFMGEAKENLVKRLQERDKPFGDYRTKEPENQ